MTSIAPTVPALRVVPRAPWTAILVAGCALAVAAPIAALSRAPAADVDLVRLLRLMVLVKGALLAAGVAGLAWRFRRPVAPAYRAGYVGLAWASSVGLGLLWTLAALWPSALLLHGAAVALVALACRDPHFIPAP